MPGIELQLDFWRGEAMAKSIAEEMGSQGLEFIDPDRPYNKSWVLYMNGSDINYVIPVPVTQAEDTRDIVAYQMFSFSATMARPQGKAPK